MELPQQLAVVKKWIWLPVLLAALASASAAAVSSRLTPVYQATTSILVRPAQATNQPAYYLTLDQVAKTYAQLMTKGPLLQQVITELHLPTTVDSLQKHVTVVPERDTELLDVKVEDPSAAQAALIANTLVKDFIARTTAAEQAQITSSLQGLQTQITELETSIISEGRQIAVLQAKARLTPDQQAQLSNLQQKQSADSAAYATFVKSVDDIRTNELSRYESLSVVDPAGAPTRPVRPNTVLNAMLALVLGILLGLGLAFLLQSLDNTFKSADDVHRYLSLPVLGVLMRLKGGRAGDLVTLRQQRAPASEAFRELRTNLLFAGVDHGLKTIVVTSAAPQEGKSRTAANLAVALAQAGRRCILIDGDLRRPSLHKLFKWVDQRGLSNMIFEDRVIPEFVRDTELANLHVVCSGSIPPNPSELLGSNRMQRLMAELARAADVLVFDSPPLLAVTDAALLAARADATILVIEAGKTPRGAAIRAKEILERVGARIAGIALNKQKVGRDPYHYEYQSKDRRLAAGLETRAAFIEDNGGHGAVDLPKDSVART